MSISYKIIIILTSDRKLDSNEHFITTKTPTKLLLYSHAPIQPKLIPQTKEEIEHFYTNNSTNYYEFDEVFNLDYHSTDSLFFHNNPLSEVGNKQNLLYIFFSFDQTEKMKIFNLFVNKFSEDLTGWFSITKINNVVEIDTIVSYNQQQKQIKQEKVDNINDLNIKINESSTIFDNYLNTNNLKSEDVTLFINVTFLKEIKVGFIKTKSILPEPNTMKRNREFNFKEYLNMCLDISNEQQSLFSLNSYDQISIMSTIKKDTNPQYNNQSLNELSILYQCYKELTKERLFDSIQIPTSELYQPINNSLTNSAMKESLTNNSFGYNSGLKSSNQINNQTIIVPDISLVKDSDENSLKLSKLSLNFDKEDEIFKRRTSMKFEEFEKNVIPEIKEDNISKDENSQNIKSDNSTNNGDNINLPFARQKISHNTTNTIIEPDLPLIINDSLKFSKNSLVSSAHDNNNFNFTNSNNNILETLVKSLHNVEGYITGEKMKAQNEVNEIKEELLKTKDDNLIMEETIKKLEHDLEMVKEDNYSLKRQKNQMENVEKNLSKKIEEKNGLIKEFQDKIENQQEEINILRADNDELNKRIDLYEQKFQLLKQSHDYMMKKIDYLQGQFNLIINNN